MSLAQAILNFAVIHRWPRLAGWSLRRGADPAARCTYADRSLLEVACLKLDPAHPSGDAVVRRLVEAGAPVTEKAWESSLGGSLWAPVFLLAAPALARDPTRDRHRLGEALLARHVPAARSLAARGSNPDEEALMLGWRLGDWELMLDLLPSDPDAWSVQLWGWALTMAPDDLLVTFANHHPQPPDPQALSVTARGRWERVVRRRAQDQANALREGTDGLPLASPQRSVARL